MSASQRGRKYGELVGCLANEHVLYLFRPADSSRVVGLGNAPYTQLGWGPAVVLALFSQPKILGANSPKPPRVCKQFGQRNFSAFCGTDKLSDAKAAGWRLDKAALSTSLRREGKTITAVIQLGGVNYCWPVSSADFAAFGQELGWKHPSSITSETEQARCVRASGLPRPGKIKLKLEGGSVFSSFVAPNASPEGAWFGRTEPLFYRDPDL